MLIVYVRKGERADTAIKKLRKMCDRDGINKEMKKHAYYEKPSERRRRVLRKAIKREQELLAEKAKK